MNTCRKIAGAIFGILVVFAMVCTVGFVVSLADIRHHERATDHRACLRGAANGLEIERCK